MKLQIFYLNRKDGLNPNQFWRVHIHLILVVEDLVTFNILLYDIDVVDGNIIGELAVRFVQIDENTVRHFRYNRHIWYVSNNNAAFQSLCCPNCDPFFKRTFNLERNLTICSKGVKNVYPRNAYQIPETIYDKLKSFGIKYPREQKVIKNSAIFDFESICVR